MAVPKFKAGRTLVRDFGNVVSMTRAMAMFDRGDSRAMTRDALAVPGAALILGTLLLLSAP
jgi:hypothetical protein